MLLLLSVLLLAGATLAYLKFGWCALDPFPWPLYGAMLAASALGAASSWRSRRRAVRVASALASAAGLLFVGMHAVSTDYGEARPLGPEVGAGFPRTTRVDVLGERAVPVGVAPPGARGQLVVFFRGFW